MDTVDYAEIAEEVLETIKEAGQGMVLYSAGAPGEYDEITDTYTDPIPDMVIPFFGVFGEIGYTYATKASGNLELRDRMIFAEAINIEPKLSDRVFIMGEQWSLINIEPVAPAGIPVLYELHIRP